ncbi:DUF58 domain-containing protein [Polluticoccus soli]|uniref:DUF58 domain-containing protein n=1 Tax=Polluticoccus soli TaxID=3034150 RepID=UPI0023E3459B|nr:DUF58 domain-containing protein [Flavipsychrobacter sp. JY13-12]
MFSYYIGNLFLRSRWFLMMASVVVAFLLSFFFPALYEWVVAYAALAVILSIADYVLLFGGDKTVRINRDLPQRFSLGDENIIKIKLTSTFPFAVNVSVIEELPEQFQQRNFQRHQKLPPRQSQELFFKLSPKTRGEYEFGETICYISSPLNLLQRRVKARNATTVKAYPSYQQLKKYQLLALSNTPQSGVKKTRRIGHSMEFEKIKNYVHGDDVRTINWKATARTSNLMVNTFTDTRQQQVYCLIDKGRIMKMPFDEMTLLDYSINSALALSNIVLMKHDRAGLITFSNTINTVVAAEKRTGQLNFILEALYHQQTDFMESDYEALSHFLHNRVTQRSCLLLFTNFETMASLERQLPYLKRIASRHLLCVIFFQNTLLQQIHTTQPNTTEGIYIKTIADRFAYEKRQIVKELRRQGIISILTTPKDLTINTINKYLELKARQLT